MEELTKEDIQGLSESYDNFIKSPLAKYFRIKMEEYKKTELQMPVYGQKSAAIREFKRGQIDTFLWVLANVKIEIDTKEKILSKTIKKEMLAKEK
jgi:hypothetical protein